MTEGRKASRVSKLKPGSPLAQGPDPPLLLELAPLRATPTKKDLGTLMG